MTGVMNTRLTRIHLDNDENSWYRWIKNILGEFFRALLCFLQSKQLIAVNPPPPPSRAKRLSWEEGKERGDREGLSYNCDEYKPKHLCLKSDLLFFEGASAVNREFDDKEFESSPELADKGMLFSSLPEEIQVDIFLMLPFKSILACRRVSKVWRSLLCSHYFIKRQLLHAKPKLMLKSNYYLKNQKVLFRSIDYASLSSSPLSVSDTTCICVGDIPMDYVLRDMLCDSIRMLGSCNGLICMSLNSYEDICIWNPSTGEYRKVPAPSNNFFVRVPHKIVYAFYYDCIADNYKLVRIAQKKKSGDYKVDVYTLGSKSCKKFKSINCYIFRERFISIFFMNGALHWTGFSNVMGVGSNVIVSFDVKSERFVDFYFPEEVDQLISKSYMVYDSVGVLEDCLSLGIYEFCSCRVDIWLMKEYGVRESWTKRFSCSTSNNHLSLGWKLLWCFTNGELLIDARENKLFCDPKNDRSRVLKTHGMSDDDVEWSLPLNYVESLVSPSSVCI